MALIELKDGTRAYVDGDMDFRLLVEKYMGYDAGYWFMRYSEDCRIVEDEFDLLDLVEEFYGVGARDILEDYYEDEQKNLGKWLKKRRESIPLSQKQLAAIIGIINDERSTSPSLSNVISKIERGERNIPVKYRKAYAEALLMPFERLDAACNRFGPKVKE